MDETPVYFDLTSKYTYDIRGKKTVSIRSTKGSKQRCTFLLSVASDGTMLPPYVILKSKNLKPFKNPFEDFCVLRHKNVGWITEKLTKDWVDRILLNLKLGKM